ncbi:MAG: TMEM165/GDT1 family protein [Allosphingosinicella sp.]
MDALVSAFVATAAAEWGDKTQLLLVLLLARSRRGPTLFAALFAATAISSVLAAIAGVTIKAMIAAEAMTLLLSLALLFAGLAGLIRRFPPNVEESRLPLFVAAAILFLAAEVGDRSQFLTFALAGHFNSAPMAAAGAIAGTLAAAIPVFVVGNELERRVSTRAVRYLGATVFIAAGFILAMKALRLV